MTSCSLDMFIRHRHRLHRHCSLFSVVTVRTTAHLFSFVQKYFITGLEPRVLTRWDCHAYARRAYDMGIRYIGGCCGFEPYHTRAIAEELSEERGRLPPGHVQHDMWGLGLKMHTKPWVRARYSKPTTSHF